MRAHVHGQSATTSGTSGHREINHQRLAKRSHHANIAPRYIGCLGLRAEHNFQDRANDMWPIPGVFPWYLRVRRFRHLPTSFNRPRGHDCAKLSELRFGTRDFHVSASQIWDTLPSYVSNITICHEQFKLGPVRVCKPAPRGGALRTWLKRRAVRTNARFDWFQMTRKPFNYMLTQITPKSFIRQNIPKSLGPYP